MHVRYIAIHGSGARQVLDRGADAQMHLAAERIEAAEIARAIGIDRDAVAAELEQPGLRVMRIGGEDRGMQRPRYTIDHTALPAVPRRIGGATRACEHTTIPDAITDAANKRRAD